MAEFDAIPVTRLHGVVVKALEDQILSGELEPGSMLPPEKELAEQLGVGRRAVREALRVLQNKGLVDIRMGVGTIVLRNDMDSYLDALLVNMSSYLQSNRGELEHVLEVREVIEGYALRRLIETRNDAVIVALRESIDLQREAHRRADPEEYNRHHVAFYVKNGPLRSPSRAISAGPVDRFDLSLRTWPPIGYPTRAHTGCGA